MHDEEHDENHDDTGAERRTETGTASGRIDAVRSDESGQADKEPDCDFNARQDSDVEGGGQSEIANREIVAQMIATLMQMGVSESYSGALPKPDDFNKYPVDVQERMCRWNDAFTTDESERQNLLVEAEIDQARKGMWISGALFLIAMLFSLIAYITTMSPWSFGFLAVPVVSMIVNLFEPVSSRSSRDKQKTTQPASSGNARGTENDARSS
ncbi:hypothetical protein KIH75_06500 [Bifidobacterium sp. 64T4]|uniref:hypothetical protein n=1 Tax=Bifidobacterium pongonis TaxID=2834432 RepID=UPI001C57124B|nr:hypothetical protein [Bifidobacterium pongonis]MBW3094987.1 hypothetical protein [Bifidobacterium pongonis]